MREPVLLGRVDLVVALALFTVVFFTIVAGVTPGVVGTLNDDAVYASTARALAQGRGYVLEHLPGSPPQTKYPPLFPAILSVVWWAWPNFPDNVIAMLLIVVACSAAATAVGYLYFVAEGHLPRAAAASGALLVGTSPTCAFYSRLVLSEMPFALILLLACWGLERRLRDARVSWFRDFGLGMLCALPFLTRTVGVAMILCALGLVAVREPRRLGATGAGVALAVGPWLLWSTLAKRAWADDPTVGYYTDYVGWWSDATGHLPRIAIGNLLYFGLGASIPLESLLRLLPGWLWLVVAIVVGWVPFVAAARSTDRRDATLWTLLAYGLIVVMWPWPSQRFVAAVAVLVGGLAARAAMTLAAPLGALARPVGLVLVVAGVLRNLDQQVSDVRLIQTLGQISRADTKVTDHVRWGDRIALMTWIRDNTPPDAVVLANNEPLIFMYAERQGFRPFHARSVPIYYFGEGPAIDSMAHVDALAEQLSADYVALMPMPTFPEYLHFARLVDDWREEMPHRLELVYQGEDPRYVVYRILRPAG